MFNYDIVYGLKLDMIIDAHHHLWEYNSVDYGWMDDSMDISKKYFEPFSAADKEKVYRSNCREFYGLDI